MKKVQPALSWTAVLTLCACAGTSLAYQPQPVCSRTAKPCFVQYRQGHALVGRSCYRATHRLAASSDDSLAVGFNTSQFTVAGVEPLGTAAVGEQIVSSPKGVQDQEVVSVAASSGNSYDLLDPLRFRGTLYDLSQAAIVGVSSGFAISLFKLSIEAIRDVSYSQAIFATNPKLVALVPALGGLVVGIILLLGAMPPGLRGTVDDVDLDSVGPVRSLRSRAKMQLASVRKSAAAVFTLGTGCSLGPEGPCVELGMNTARAWMDVDSRLGHAFERRDWNRVLLSCGAAAGVAAGFDAPLAGVFFALEVMQSSFSERSKDDGVVDTVLSTSARIAPILLASVLSALVAQSILGDHLILRLTQYNLKTPLLELPLYLLLGSVSGFVSFFFSQTAKVSRSFFDGNIGNDAFRGLVRSIPTWSKPMIGGLMCGLIGLVFPQILFFGYETLNSLLAKTSLPTGLILMLLVVKTFATAISAGSGLVGGTFAPSLFLGAMTGACFHNVALIIMQLIFGSAGLGPPALADVPAYAMVGAASVLAGLFRAPLTASLLLFELTRDYEVILPLMASAGIASVVGDILDGKQERVEQRRKLRRDRDSVSWGDLADPVKPLVIPK